jgi:sulfite exporter TauE/SafE
MSYLYLAFFMGLFGSLHCVAMCGPLVLALPNHQNSRKAILINKVLYQIGRIAMYGFLGLILGIIGNSIAVKGWQQGISLFSGGLLISIGLFNLFKSGFPRMVRLQTTLMGPVIRKMGYWLYRPGGSLMAGVINGLLPCGMVYMALASALNANSIENAALFMVFFGLGTFPMMTFVSLLGNFLKSKLKFNFNKWLPMMLILMGIWFLLRGANLDIPYLSPVLFPEGAMICS